MTQDQIDRLREAVANAVYDILVDEAVEFDSDDDASHLANDTADEFTQSLRRVIRKAAA
jgi:hypothetical protein